MWFVHAKGFRSSEGPALYHAADTTFDLVQIEVIAELNMAFDLLKVCVFGCNDPEWLAKLRLGGMSSEEASGFDIHAFDDDAQLEQILVDLRPQVFVSFGQSDTYRRLWGAPLDIRQRWINVEDPETAPTTIADRIMETFITNLT